MTMEPDPGGMMDFLVLMQAVNPMPLDDGRLAELALAQMSFWQRLRERGSVVYTAPYVGRRARVAVFRVTGTDELMDLINADPLFLYLDREVIPLGANEQLERIYRSRVEAAEERTGP